MGATGHGRHTTETVISPPVSGSVVGTVNNWIFNESAKSPSDGRKDTTSVVPAAGSVGGTTATSKEGSATDITSHNSVKGTEGSG